MHLIFRKKMLPALLWSEDQDGCTIIAIQNLFTKKEKETCLLNTFAV